MKRRLGLKTIEVPYDIAKNSANQKLDKIEQFANQRKMNRTQVKAVIRGMLETPYLLNKKIITRSQISLKEVTLAVLETQFIPPDITSNMYVDLHSSSYNLKRKISY